MTTANSLQLTAVRESTAGTTPGTPRMRTMRLTKESLFYAPIFNQSEELRSDRMTDAPTQIIFESAGGIDFEFSYPKDESVLSEIFRSAFYSTWTNTNSRDNDGTADSVITDIATTNTVLTCTTGTSFVAGELYYFSGFGVTANNGTFKCTTGSATVPRFVGSGITDEPIPPAAARVKACGFEGAASDITATSTGLASTLLDFTTISGLAVGKWIKIDSTTSGYGFSVSALNDWMRITAISANAITCDNRPSGWTTNAGTGKTIRVYVGDQIKNGTTQTSLSIERGFMRQTSPTYIVNTGMSVEELMIDIKKRSKVLASCTFMGMGGSQGTSALDGTPDAATTNAVMSAHVNVGRLAENGVPTASPNWASAFTLKIKNNQRTIEDVTASSPQGVLDGECTVTGTLETYFGSNAVLTRFFNATTTSFNSRTQKNNQAIVFTVPQATLSGGGRPNATGKNTDVYASFEFTASKETTYTNAHILCDRLEYYA